MPDSDDQITIRTIQRMADVSAADWDACAGADNPFVGHAFLSALEESGSADAEAGWLPQHLIVHDAAGGIVGCAPLYVKSHSYGEYVFDHGWADAWERAGGEYYPKLLCGVPFSPVPGPRLLVRPGPDAARIEQALGAAMVEVGRQIGASSVHINFLPEDQWRRLGEMGLLQRTGQQFHWENRGYESFDGFLESLNSRKRKAIRKERREVVDAGVTLRALSGGEIEKRHWDAFWRFYRNTSDRKWGQAYLTRDFFSRIAETMADKIVLVVAEAGNQIVAGALNLRGTDTLYGRNWGCSAHYPFLHFEACYYQAIDYAIRHGLKRVEAGAQGQHKIQRGYLPVPTYSAHWIEDSRFRRAVADFLERERAAVAAGIEELTEFSPFRREDGSAG
ncbi:putative N-acyltransferase [Constrictibacter sp. MBR-5]|jgi:predicted N-acyltransferase|uniref:GNAT family N-acetyltransferase n=1 Tax=Constrictibacter sp. MBR-5 TaxID=3156467 RepID=UPI0033994136